MREQRQEIIWVIKKNPACKICWVSSCEWVYGSALPSAIWLSSLWVETWADPCWRGLDYNELPACIIWMDWAIPQWAQASLRNGQNQGQFSQPKCPAAQQERAGNWEIVASQPGEHSKCSLWNVSSWDGEHNSVLACTRPSVRTPCHNIFFYITLCQFLPCQHPNLYSCFPVDI